MLIEKILKNSTDYRLACSSHSHVLLRGATGTGKSALARRIHDEGPRSARSFVTVNLATIHAGTIESELFGHERGSFTGAEAKRVGRLEYANGGTLFLDEIGELSLPLQARLLEFLQTGVIVPVGSNREIKLDVRVIAATHRNLEKSVEEGLFREDLFYRLCVIELHLKSLNDRSEEFDSIVHDVIDELCVRHHRKILRLSPEFAQTLERYRWPGNIRELRNVLEYAIIASTDGVLDITHFPAWFLSRNRQLQKTESNKSDSSFQMSSESASQSVMRGLASSQTLNYELDMQNFEREYLRNALDLNQGRLSRTARRLGMNKTTLFRRVHRYGLMTNSIEDSKPLVESSA